MTHDRQGEQQQWLIAALQNPRAFDHPVDEVALIQTHISYVLLTGQFAYKIKKSLNLGFLDFSTLEKRRRCCQEELRLNRRTAPQLYLDVIPVTGSPERPRMGGAGTPIEYAVRMRQFPQRALAAYLMAEGELRTEHMVQIATTLAEFHGRVEVAAPDSPWGAPHQVQGPVMDNFKTIAAMVDDTCDLRDLTALRRWSEQTFDSLGPELAARKSGGFIRECHGDLHLGNLVMLDGRLTAFDCIEFNPALRWIDVMSEAAFMAMDLEDHGLSDFAWRFLNTYLEHTGDYAGMSVLAYYKTYRAMVRAKVSRVRLGQTGIGAGDRKALDADFRGYIRLAQRYTRRGSARLIITHGLSGSGKTTLARALADRLGAVHIRSDIERKRLFGLQPDQRSGSRPDQGLYSREAGERTYRRLADVAARLLDCGYPVIADATFLRGGDRARFQAIAADRHLPFTLLDVQAPTAVLRTRIGDRFARARDASEADQGVLDNQLRHREPLTAAEQVRTVCIDTSRPQDSDALAQRLLTGSAPAESGAE